MTDSVFPYPGAKSQMAKWIVGKFPRHECFVDAFGGSASIMVNKPKSRVEVYNDLDGDLVHFFKVLRDEADELVEWLSNVPYSRELYDSWATAFYNGERPVDDIERAGRFYFLRYSQFGGKYDAKKGFRIAKKKDDYAGVDFARSIDDLKEFRDRFQGVIIENMDYQEVIRRYDRETTLFYFDPPYVDVGDIYYSHEGEFDQEEFVTALEEIDGFWLASYGDDFPQGLEKYTMLSKDQRYTLNNGQSGGGDSVETERLFMNFDPDQEMIFSGATQSTLGQSFIATDGGNHE